MDEEDLLEDSRLAGLKSDAWSPSRLKAWELCGHQGKLKYIDHTESEPQASFAFGSSVHETIKFMHERDGFEHKKWYPFWMEIWFNESDRVDWDHQSMFVPRRKTYDALGPKILEAYSERNAGQETLLCEWKFPTHSPLFGDLRFFIGEYEVQGIIDRVIDLPKQDAVVVLDYKTAKNEPSPKVLRLDAQFTMYHYVVSKLRDLGLLPARRHVWVAWYHLRNTGARDPVIWTHRDEKDWKLLETMLGQVNGKLDRRDFARNPGYHCTFCPVILSCTKNFEMPSSIDKSRAFWS